MELNQVPFSHHEDFAIDYSKAFGHASPLPLPDHSVRNDKLRATIISSKSNVYLTCMQPF